MEPAEYDLMDAAEGRMWWYRALHARLSDALRGVTGRVLDAGCGTGGFLSTLAPPLRPVGLEFSAVAAGRAGTKSGAPVVRGSVNAMPFADGSFDAAIAADVLCHAAVDPAAALIEIRRVLRPGGRLVVNMPAYVWLMSAHDRRVHNVRRQTAGELHAALAAAGFIRIRARYWNGLLLPLMIAERKLFARADNAASDVAVFSERKLFARADNAASDVAVFSPWLDATLHGITALERRLPFPLPAGGSVLATAEAP